MSRRRKFMMYVDEDVYHRFAESIKETGFSVSRMVEFMMRANNSRAGKSFGQMLDEVFNIRESTKRRK